MPRTVRYLILTTLCCLSLSGCVISVNSDDFESDTDNWRDRQDKNEHAINRLRLGADVESIIEELGDADFRESFLRDGEEFTVLYYRTRRIRDDGKTTKDETTPIVFVDGELVGWGDSAIEHATHRVH